MFAVESGKDIPYEFNVFIEISTDSPSVKYELDKESGLLHVDRFLYTSMRYPCNYGFVPKTLAGDGDPLDVLVYSSFPVMPGTVIKVRPIGVLVTEDEKGEDMKLLVVPTKKIDPILEGIEDLKDLPEIFLQQIKHFFERYKDLEAGKWVKVQDWRDSDYARQLLNKSVKAYDES